MLVFKIFLILIGTLGLLASIYLILQFRQAEIQLNFTPLLENTHNTLNLDSLPKNDYNTLIDMKFEFKTLNLLCKNESSEPLLLILVHSSTGNFLKRQVIRDTWGKPSRKLRVAFLVGRPVTDETNAKLRTESLQNQDIIQGDFLDSYQNITYKHTMGMKYFIYHCIGAKYVLKVDDDIFVNTPKLKKFLTEEVSFHGAKDMILCITVVQARTLRSYRNKWRIGFEEYPKRYFPTFCRGMAILYSPDVLFNLYRMAQMNKKYVKLDDVFYTGITAAKIGYTSHSNIAPLMSFTYNDGIGQAYIPSDFNSYLFIGSELSEKDIMKLWNRIQKQKDF